MGIWGRFGPGFKDLAQRTMSAFLEARLHLLRTLILILWLGFAAGERHVETQRLGGLSCFR